MGGMNSQRRIPAQVEVVDDAIADILRRKTPLEKLQMIASGWELLRAMHASQVRRAHPDWDEARVQAETSARMANGST
jgi:Rv0078B-related antitoxin